MPHDLDLIAALLGPADEELSCTACFERLDEYVDAELQRPGLADAAVPGMRAHLRGCPACAEDHAALLALAAAS